MKETRYAVGDRVKVTTGVYADVIGVVADIKEECSTVRIETADGVAYAYTDAVQKFVPHGKTKPVLLKR